MDMDRKTSTLIAVGTVASALTIGAVMQYWPTSQSAPIAKQATVAVTDVQEVSSTPKPANSLDLTPSEILPASLGTPPIEDAAPITEDTSQEPETSSAQCDATMTATPAAGAMINIDLTAPCHGGERVTLHHNGLMFTDAVAPDGTLQVQVPALTENALVVASFLDGGGAVATSEITSVPFYDRIVLQWRGDAGLQLHAREFDAQYFAEGHVWHGAATDPSRATAGEGGFLTALGNENVADALMAEVYTFPTGMTDASGTVALTVEAEIIDSNCNAVIEAQTLELRGGDDLTSKELTIDVPSCETVGDFLLLKNIVQDLTIAAN